MDIAIISTSYKHCAAWKRALQERLPNTNIHIFSESEKAKDAGFLLCWRPEAGQLMQFSDLKLIQSLGAGVDHLFHENDIPVNTRITRIIDPQLSEDMWEYTLTAVMSHLKNFSIYRQQQQEKRWKQRRYKIIQDVTIGIMGLGRIGIHVANKFAQVGFKVLGWSNSLKDNPNITSFAGAASFANFMAQTEILINILPLTNKTRCILNAKNLSLLPKGAYVINVGRGGHLEESDLIPLIDSGQLAGATLDVFEQEPLPEDHPFWRHPKISVTPHIASVTNIKTASEQVVENYFRIQNGKALLNEVSVKAGY